MKKLLLLLSIFNGICSGVFAQTFSIEPSIGIGGSEMKHKPTDELYGSFNMSKTTINVGALLVYSSRKNFEWGVGLKYSSEGGRRDLNFPNTDLVMHEDIGLNYLRIPIRATYLVNKGRKFVGKFSLGPSFGVLISGKNSIEYKWVFDFNSPPAPPPVMNDSKDNWKKFDLSATTSVGGSYKISKNLSLVAEGTLLRGITDNRRENKKNMDGYPRGKSFKSNTNTFNVGVSLRL